MVDLEWSLDPRLHHRHPSSPLSTAFRRPRPFRTLASPLPLGGLASADSPAPRRSHLAADICRQPADCLTQPPPSSIVTVRLHRKTCAFPSPVRRRPWLQLATSRASSGCTASIGCVLHIARRRIFLRSRSSRRINHHHSVPVVLYSLATSTIVFRSSSPISQLCQPRPAPRRSAPSAPSVSTPTLPAALLQLLPTAKPALPHLHRPQRVRGQRLSNVSYYGIFASSRPALRDHLAAEGLSLSPTSSSVASPTAVAPLAAPVLPPSSRGGSGACSLPVLPPSLASRPPARFSPVLCCALGPVPLRAAPLPLASQTLAHLAVAPAIV